MARSERMHTHQQSTNRLECANANEHRKKVECGGIKGKGKKKRKQHRRRWKTMENSSKDFSCAQLFPPQSLSFVFDVGVILALVVFCAAADAVIRMCHLYARILHNSKHVLFCIKRYLMLSFLCRFVSCVHRRRQPFVVFLFTFFCRDTACACVYAVRVCRTSAAQAHMKHCTW